MNKIIKGLISIILISSIAWIVYAYYNVDKIVEYRDNKTVVNENDIKNLEVIQNQKDNENIIENEISNRVNNNLENNIECNMIIENIIKNHNLDIVTENKTDNIILENSIIENNIPR